jgi:hypothetical protein
MEETVEWLLQGPAYVRYRTLIDIGGEGNLEEARKELFDDSRIRTLIRESSSWPGKVLKRHNDANLLIHKICFLSEIGLTNRDSGIHKIAEKIMSDRDPTGPFRILTHLYERFGGSGKDELAWFLCDAPTVVYFLAKLGYHNDERVVKARDFLVSLVQENGWRCEVSKELGRMKGPGPRTSECPYANLLMLKLISAYPMMIEEKEARIGINTILCLWDDRKRRKPFLFGMGTDFRKLKAPLMWYDILHLTEVLSRFPYARKDERLHQMFDIIKEKADDMGRYTPESIWKAWKGWDFCQKKEPSPWITYRILNIEKRIYNNI